MLNGSNINGAVPALAHAQPDELQGMSDEALAALQSIYAAAQSKIAAEQFRRARVPKTQAKAEPQADRMLTVDEAAARLRRSRAWIYRHADTLPFVRRISRKSLLCSETDLQRWLERRRRS